jgi:hypothetical protein
MRTANHFNQSKPFKKIKTFTMKIKQSFAIMALVAAIVCESQTTNAQSWNLTGNSNATTSSKLGTTNAMPLRLMTNNQPRLYIDATGNIAVGPGGNGTDPRYRLYVSSASGAAGSIWGDGGSNNNIGVVGTGTYGLWGSGGNGVYGNGINHGVWGNSSNGYGVYGVSSTNYGVVGQSSYLGVYGQGNTFGVFGQGNTYGTYGQSTDGNGVQGHSENGYGGYFYSTNLYGLRAATGVSGGYAGVFDGNVYAFGSYFSSSDKNLKKNIQDFGNAMSIINQLKPKNYEFRTDDAKFASFNLPKGTHYGLIAQDVEQVLPNLVKETPQEIGRKEDKLIGLQLNDKGEAIPAATEQKVRAEQAKKEVMNIKGVNYEELIPILIKGMQEQDKVIHDQGTKIEELTQLVQKLQGSPISSSTHSNDAVSSASLSSASLSQNVPNPLTNSTSIGYTLPVGISKAVLTITDSNGSTVKQISINGGGKGAVSIETSTLSAGTYYYSLIVNGKPIETRTMVIAR